MKVIQLTTKVAEAVIYDEEAMTIDFSAGNDFAIRSTLLPSCICVARIMYYDFL